MSVRSRVRARLLVCCIAAIATLGALVLAPAAGAFTIGNTYLALGDSLAYGYHQAQFEAEYPNIIPASFNDGYVDDFGGFLKAVHPGLNVTNDGCPGETTETMINGSGIPFYCAGGPTGTPFPDVWLHHPYPAGGSQLSDALAILAANPNVSPITLDIGANDLIQFDEHTCGFPAKFTCSETQVGVEIGHIAANVYSILAQLRAAAPHAQIVLMGIYNAFPAVVKPEGTGDKAIAAFNAAEASVAAKVPGTSFANPLPLFNPSVVTGGPETGDIPTICAFTAMCPDGVYNPASPKADIHPTRLGYAVLAADVGFAFITH